MVFLLNAFESFSSSMEVTTWRQRDFSFAL